MLEYRHIIEDLVVERLLTSNKDNIPIIISSKHCNCDNLEKYITKMGGIIKYKLPIINSVAVYMPSVGVKSMAMEEITEKIYLDDYAFKLMDIASVTVGSDFAQERGVTGKNISVAVVDTGVYPHEDLITPNNRIIAFKDFVGNKKEPYDDDGHGSHVAGTIAGNGYSSKGRYMGIAPDANIVGVKVLSGEGGGNISDVIAGIQWVVNNKDKYNIKVMTLSLGAKPKASYMEDPLCQAVGVAVDSGITVVTAAGNSGPKASTITSPAISPKVISVGACDDRNFSNSNKITIADFSSRGPTLEGLKKPDLLAPGVKIHSLKNNQHEYVSLSGTSMAAPIVAGCAALLYEGEPKASPSHIKGLLTNNAMDLGLDANKQGAGLINIDKIIPIKKPGVDPSLPENSTGDLNDFNQRTRLKSNDWFLILLVVIILLIL